VAYFSRDFEERSYGLTLAALLFLSNRAADATFLREIIVLFHSEEKSLPYDILDISYPEYFQHCLMYRALAIFHRLIAVACR